MNMTIYTELSFDSSHQLKGTKGPCDRLHGHTYRVEMWLYGPVQEDGMVVDFARIKEIVRVFDHEHLNDLTVFQDIPTTVENLCRLLRDQIWEAFEHLERVCVRVWETRSSYAETVRSE